MARQGFGRKRFCQAVFAYAEAVRAAGEGAWTKEGGLALVARPLLAHLGYSGNPLLEIAAPHRFAAPGRLTHPVDIAVLRAGRPVIALNQYALGGDRYEARYHVREYIKAMGGEAIGIVSDGRLIEFFLAAKSSDTLDDTPFLTLDLSTLTAGKAGERKAQQLYELTAWRFSHIKAVRRLRWRHRIERWFDWLGEGVIQSLFHWG
jgi:hypothetical protein